MICNDVYWKGSPIQVVTPDPEHLKLYSKEFLIMHVVVQLSIVKGMGVESNQMDFSRI